MRKYCSCWQWWVVQHRGHLLAKLSGLLFVDSFYRYCPLRWYFRGWCFLGICKVVGLRALTLMDLGWVSAGICFWSQDLQVAESVVDRLQTVERRLSGNADDALARLRGALPPCMLTSPQMFYPCALHFKWFKFVTQLWTIPQHRHRHPTLKV